MALFKILKGNKASLPVEKTEGYMYITKDTGDIYVDTASSNIIWNETVSLTFLETDTYDYKSNISSNELVVSDDY